MADRRVSQLALRLTAIGIAWPLATGISLGCASALPTVPTGAHVQALIRPQLVDAPPPPARIETVAEPWPKACAWLDGSFAWNGKYWDWQPGRWISLEPHCYYAEPLVVWVTAGDAGALYYVPGQWYRAQEGRRCSEPRPCHAAVPRAPARE